MKKGILGVILVAGVLTVGCAGKGKLDGEYTMKIGKLQCSKFTIEDNHIKDYYDGETKKDVKSKYDPKTETITFKVGKENHELKLENGTYKYDNITVNKNKATQILDAAADSIKETTNKAVNDWDKEQEKLEKNWKKEQEKLEKNWKKEQKELQKDWEKTQKELKDSLGE